MPRRVLIVDPDNRPLSDAAGTVIEDGIGPDRLQDQGMMGYRG